MATNDSGEQTVATTTASSQWWHKETNEIGGGKTMKQQ